MRAASQGGAGEGLGICVLARVDPSTNIKPFHTTTLITTDSTNHFVGVTIGTGIRSICLVVSPELIHEPVGKTDGRIFPFNV